MVISVAAENGGLTMRLIDADELFTTPMPNARGNGKPLLSLWAYVVDQITHAPTIDPESLRPVGRWISTENKPHMLYSCSVCKERWGYGAMLHMKYCPNCGARMEG